MNIIKKIFRIFNRKKETREEKLARLIEKAAKKGELSLLGFKIAEIKFGKRTIRPKNKKGKD